MVGTSPPPLGVLVGHRDWRVREVGYAAVLIQAGKDPRGFGLHPEQELHDRAPPRRGPEVEWPESQHPCQHPVTGDDGSQSKEGHAPVLRGRFRHEPLRGPGEFAKQAEKRP